MPNIKDFKTAEEYREYYREYRKKNREKLRDYNRLYNREWRLRNGLEKDRVRSETNRALKTGAITKKPCEVCGGIKVQAHHEDYSKPLEVIWLCTVHHKERHVNKGVSAIHRLIKKAVAILLG